MFHWTSLRKQITIYSKWFIVLKHFTLFTWYLKLSFRVKRLKQIKHWNCRGFKHSNLMWLSKFFLSLYDLLQTSHENLLFSIGINRFSEKKNRYLSYCTYKVYNTMPCYTDIKIVACNLKRKNFSRFIVYNCFHHCVFLNFPFLKIILNILYIENVQDLSTQIFCDEVNSFYNYKTCYKLRTKTF